MAAEELALSAALGGRILAAAGLDGPVERAEPLAGGEGNPVFRLEGPAGRFVVWVNRRDPDRPKVAKQAWAYGALRAAGLPAPEVLGIDLTRTVLPFDYLVMRYVPGDPLSELAPGSPPDVRRDLGRAAGRLLGELHRMDLDGRLPPGAAAWGDPFDPARGAESWAAFLTAWTEDQLDAARRVLDPGRARAIRDAVTELARDGAAAGLGPDSGSRLVHRDFQGTNLIVAPPDAARGGVRALAALVDFEWAVLGDPRFEFGALDEGGVRTLGDPDAFWAAYRDAIPERPADAHAIAVYRLLYAVEVLGVVWRGGLRGRDVEAARRAVARRLDALR